MGFLNNRRKMPGSKSAPDASYTSVSVRGAIAYCNNALNYLLGDDNYHISVGPVVFCFWCKKSSKIPGLIGQIFNNAYPEHVKGLLGSQFAGIEPPEVLRQEHYVHVGIIWECRSCNGKAVDRSNIRRCHRKLKSMVAGFAGYTFYSNVAKKMKKTNVKGRPLSPYRMYALAETTLRRSKNRKNEKLIADRVIQLYLAALKGSSLPIILLKPILDEFHSALVKESEEERTYPFSTSRFALIKLILLRNSQKKEDKFMPKYELADTPDPAYNLGRLLAVFENLQDKYHNYERKGAGVVERYYGTASSAPASSFPFIMPVGKASFIQVKKGRRKRQSCRVCN